MLLETQALFLKGYAQTLTCRPRQRDSSSEDVRCIERHWSCSFGERAGGTAAYVSVLSPSAALPMIPSPLVSGLLLLRISLGSYQPHPSDSQGPHSTLLIKAVSSAKGNQPGPMLQSFLKNKQTKKQTNKHNSWGSPGKFSGARDTHAENWDVWFKARAIFLQPWSWS